ncbi:PAS domain S-box-containing protein [Candidatus Electrothrix marina]|uniref:histidine kinase n=1 Tax=Candidatus Electrothrix marina TaxID=1859130 RepID=A0A444JGZ3_9BACT|nr:PAS domain S-box-containing protein [Candidatus Electrothrix marina]
MVDNSGEIMVVDDTLENLRLLTDMLSSEGYKVRPTQEPGLALDSALAAPPDLFLLDVKMPGIDGYELCRRLKQDKRTAEVPVIFVSALQELHDRVRGFEVGGVDFISKPIQREEVLARVKNHLQLRRMQKNLEEIVAERTVELQNAYETVRKNEVRYRSLFNDALDMVHIVGLDGKIIDANLAELQTLGYSEEEYIGMPLLDIVHPDEREKTAAVLRRVFSGETVRNYETVFVAQAGELINVELNAFPQIEGGRVIFERAIIRNITERKKEEKEKKKLEHQLFQTQRLEAIGTLAGGIAHDFNNILSPILGYAELVQQKLSIGSELWREQQAIIDAGNRAKELVQQILSISRQGEHERRPLQIHLIVKEALKLLRASIPTTIEIRQDIQATSGVVHADPTKIHQIIMNLCTNAYHAMQETGGILGVSLRVINVEKNGEFFLAMLLPPGRYLRLEVSDTGYGMEKKILDRIFDPYFTTKGQGQGTGLGLAIAQGIVLGYGGHISVYSSPGAGSVFHVYLPYVESSPAESCSTKQEPLPVGNEKILLLDDEEVIVAMGQKILEDLGYRVTTLTSSKDAWQLLRDQPDFFDLIITDMTMPDMTGLDLADKYLALRPNASIILCTGFSKLVNGDQAKASGMRGFLMKPISRKELAKTVRRVLDDNPQRR